MYYRGTQAYFDTWHAAAKTTTGIPGEGLISIRSGLPDPTGQRTVEYSTWIQHPLGGDDGIYLFGDQTDEAKTSLDRDEVIALGWFTE